MKSLPSTPERGRGAVVHQAAFTWSDTVPVGHPREVADALNLLLPQLEGVLFFSFGENLDLTPRAADFGVCGVFEDASAFRDYAGHPAHLDILNDLVLPYAADRTVVQYAL